jgi:hypothetical protein
MQFKASMSHAIARSINIPQASAPTMLPVIPFLLALTHVVFFLFAWQKQFFFFQ